MEEEEEMSDEEDDEDLFEDEDDEKLDLSPVENDPKIAENVNKICEMEDQQETNKKEKIDLERQRAQVFARIDKLQRQLKTAEEELKDYQRKKL